MVTKSPARSNDNPLRISAASPSGSAEGNTLPNGTEPSPRPGDANRPNGSFRGAVPTTARLAQPTVIAGGARTRLRASALVELGAKSLAELPMRRPQPLVIDRLDPSGHTILFGAGGVGKGILATWWMVRLTQVGHRVLILDYEDHPEEWSSRFPALGGDLQSAPIWVSPMSSSWGGRVGALWTHAGDIKRLVEETSSSFLVIDFIVPACGGADPIDPGTVTRYANALTHLGRPTLSLGHIPKTGDHAHPYGSAFWQNFARTTWSLSRKQGRLLLEHRKSNNHPHQGRLEIEIAWSAGLPTRVSERRGHEFEPRRTNSRGPL